MTKKMICKNRTILFEKIERLSVFLKKYPIYSLKEYQLNSKRTYYFVIFNSFRKNSTCRILWILYICLICRVYFILKLKYKKSLSF